MSHLPPGLFRYRLDWRGGSTRPGQHRSRVLGGGFEVHEQGPMRLGEDPRRLDLRRSARDPLQRLWVRRMRHSNACTVSVLADLSASMAVRVEHHKHASLLRFIASTLRSASACGDRFALHCADQHYRPALSLSARRCAELPAELSRRLRCTEATGSGAEGLLQAAAQLDRRRGLVFLVSDFYWPETLMQQIASALTHTQWVPVMLCERRAPSRPTPLLRVCRDAESGRQRLVLHPPWRPTAQCELVAHRARVAAVFSSFGVRLLELEEGFDEAAVGAYFYA